MTKDGEREAARGIDVCVVCYHSEDLIPSMLRSIGEHLPAESRVLLWSNSSPDDLRASLTVPNQSRRQEVVVLGSGDNVGFAKGCNALARAASAEWLLFLNPDARILSWPSRVPDPVTLFGPLVYLTDGRLQRTFGRDRSLRREVQGRLLRRRDSQPATSTPFDVEFVSGVAMFVSRDRYLESGGLDERYFMYYEDIDFGRSWRTSGGRITIDPAWRVEHIGGATARNDHLAALLRSQASAEAFHEKWSGPTSRRVFRGVTIVEAFAKGLLSLPRGRIGTTTATTQWRFLWHLLRDRGWTNGSAPVSKRR